MVRAMLTVLALGAAAEENVTTTKGPSGAAPALQNYGCFAHEAWFSVAGAPAKCHPVCDQATLYLPPPIGPFPGDTKAHAMDFTKGAASTHPRVDNVIGALSHQTKLRCFGCGETVCRENHGRKCYTQAQIEAETTTFAHGCFYGSYSNTCAYDGAFSVFGRDGEVIMNDIMPEETCRYTYVGNTGMAGNVVAFEKLIQHLPEADSEGSSIQV